MRAATVETSMVRSARIVNFDGKQAFSQIHLKHNNQLVRLLSPQKWRVMNIWLLLHDDLALVCAFVVAVRTRSIIKSSVKIITLSSASSFKCNIQNQNYLLSMCQGETKNCFLCEWYMSFELDICSSAVDILLFNLLSPSGDLGIGLVWDNHPHPTGPTFWSDYWNPLQTELNYLWWVLSCS